MIRDLVQEVVAAAAEPRYARLKKMWTEHNRLRHQGRLLVSVHLHRGYTETWKELIPPEELLSTDPFERDVELQLRQKLFRHYNLPDDEVLLPTLWFAPARPRGGADRLWGVPLENIDAHDPAGAYAFRPAVRDEEDLAKMHYPHYEVDEAATAAIVARARELVDDRLPVKLSANDVSAVPSEDLVKFLGWENYLFYFLERPAFVHKLMDFLTEGFIAYQKEREAAGGVEAEDTWKFRTHYEELGPQESPHSLRSCWLYVAAQSTGTISPAMYAEFVQPYNERLVGLYGPARIYYHGCEDLTPKLDIIANLPGLRRFDVSAWTDLAACVRKFERRVVLEAQVHPGKVILEEDPAEWRRELERMREVAGDCIADVNLADVQTVKGDKTLLGRWAQMAQEIMA
ncbi:MAG: uroporphyrinogen decarboxylase family protein [Chloroflexota bacterium]